MCIRTCMSVARNVARVQQHTLSCMCVYMVSFDRQLPFGSIVLREVSVPLEVPRQPPLRSAPRWQKGKGDWDWGLDSGFPEDRTSTDHRIELEAQSKKQHTRKNKKSGKQRTRHPFAIRSGYYLCEDRISYIKYTRRIFSC